MGAELSRRNSDCSLDINLATRRPKQQCTIMIDRQLCWWLMRAGTVASEAGPDDSVHQRSRPLKVQAGYDDRHS